MEDCQLSENHEPAFIQSHRVEIEHWEGVIYF